MGANAVRTSHNPPAPELLDVCDSLGIMVMDEAFDMWRKKKNKYDYGCYFNEWHERDLSDFVRRDRNHPSVISGASATKSTSSDSRRRRHSQP